MSDAIKSRLGELAQKFVTRTTGDLVLMRESLARVESGDRAGLEQIQQLAHRACGTGGTLGLGSLSDAAGELERCVEALPGNSLPGPTERARIGAAIETLAAAITSH